MIRLLLALSLVASHCGSFFGLRLIDDETAVEAFFVISGFYMSLILNEKYVGSNSSYQLFITNRFIRLFPIYWIVLLATLLFFTALIHFTHGEAVTVFSSYSSVKTSFSSFAYLILTNIVVFGQGIAMFLGINPETGNLYLINSLQNTSPSPYNFLFVPQAWSMGLELTFYLIAPFILRRGFRFVVGLIVASLLLRLFMFNYLNLQNDPWTFRFLPTELLFFLMGYVSYRIYLAIKNKSVPNYLSLLTLFLIVVFTASHAYFPLIKISFLSFSISQVIYFLVLTLAIPIIFNFLNKNKIDNELGELSYPIYITHMLVAWFCIGLGSHSLTFSFLKEGWAIGIVTIIVSYLVNKTVASPIEKYRQGRLK